MLLILRETFEILTLIGTLYVSPFYIDVVQSLFLYLKLFFFFTSSQYSLVWEYWSYQLKTGFTYCYLLLDKYYRLPVKFEFQINREQLFGIATMYLGHTYA